MLDFYVLNNDNGCYVRIHQDHMFGVGCVSISVIILVAWLMRSSGLRMVFLIKLYVHV